MFNSVNQYLFEINALISVNVDQKKAYQLEETIAKVLPGFSPSIPVFELGAFAIKKGCLSMSFKGRRDRIEVSRFGKVRADTDLYQASIEAHYIYEQL